MGAIGDKYLPIGTVVLLEGGEKRVMITGFCPIAENNKDEMWDYSGCVYPEGFLDSKHVCLFNHDQIAEIYHLGLSDDEEEKEFKQRLKQVIEAQKANKDN